MVRPKMTKHRGEPGHTLTRTEVGRGWIHTQARTHRRISQTAEPTHRRTCKTRSRPPETTGTLITQISVQNHHRESGREWHVSGTPVESPPAALPVYRRLQASRSQRLIRVGWPDDISTERKLNIIYTGRSIMDGRKKRQNFFFYSPKNSTSFGTTHRTSGLAPLTTSPP